METSFNYETLPVRTKTDNEEQVWFAGIDVCNILGYADAHQKIKSLDEDEYRLDRITDGQGKQKETLTVNEFGLYSLILSSTKPEAKAFKRWVTHEILPTLRRSGKYTTDDEREHDARLQQIANEIQKLKNQREEYNRKISDIKKDIELKMAEMLMLIKRDKNQLSIKFP